MTDARATPSGPGPHPLLRQFFDRSQAAIGHTEEYDRGVVSALTIERYAVAIGATNPIYHDAEAARRQGFANVVAPPNFLAAMFDWTAGAPEAELNTDGTAGDGERGGDLGGLRGMGAGEQMEIHAPLVAGMRVIESVRQSDVSLKEGRRGYSVFVTNEHTFRDGSGTVLNVNRRTVVIRAPHEEVPS